MAVERTTIEQRLQGARAGRERALATAQAYEGAAAALEELLAVIDAGAAQEQAAEKKAARKAAREARKQKKAAK